MPVLFLPHIPYLIIINMPLSYHYVVFCFVFGGSWLIFFLKCLKVSACSLSLFTWRLTTCFGVRAQFSGCPACNPVAVYICTHPSLFAGVRFQDTHEKLESAKNLSPHEDDVSVFFSLFLFSAENCDGSSFFPPSAPWTSRGMARRPVRDVEQFWCSSALKGLNDVFLFSETTRRSMNLRDARDDLFVS